MNIGFIGFGNMSAPMAENLTAAGLNVTGYDPVGVTAKDVAIVGSAAEAAANADIVITMLPNGDILRAVADEIIPTMAAGAAFLDCSTVDVESLRDAKNDAQARSELEQQGGKIKVPCLRIEENGQSTWLYESKAIIAYLDERFAAV